MKTVLSAAALLLAGCAQTATVEAPRIAPVAANEAKLRQVGAAVLFWSQAERDANFPAMEKLFPVHTVKRGSRVKPLPNGTPLAIPAAEVDAFMAKQNVAGLIVVRDGRVLLERYARALTREGRWTSFSVAKSFTSTLVGAAIRDGFIRSVEEPVTRYIPELVGSGYDGVTIAQLLTMTSGVRWNEDYTDPKSDVARMFSAPVPAGMDPTVAYMRTLPRESAPGEKWVYKTGETNLIGVLVRNATRKPLATYLSETVWKRYGMESDAYWMNDQTGQEISGCCLSVTLRDYARMGMLALEGGKGIVRPDWFAQATSAKAPVGRAQYGYGYQWWTYPEGKYGANGIFGQNILVDPSRKIVIAMVSAWPKATDRQLSADRAAFQERLVTAAGN